MSTSTRVLPSYAIALLSVLGIALLVVAVIYLAQPASSIPAFFPGHVAVGSTGSAHHHTTHGIAAGVLGLVALVGAWMGAGSKKTT